MAKARARSLPKKYEPEAADALWKCTNCDSTATRAVYQHSHKKDAQSAERNREAMFTWEVPAYVDKDGALLKWRCPIHGCNEAVAAKLVKCGECGRTVYVGPRP
ncbi:hypothetical protein JXD38_11930 [candidate division WOR-3 bacterium]|nr:hypothetical protein [candidate division WOR-3 bacterium]